MAEIIVDSFAGGGGASTGIEIALGRSPDIAINHDAVALAMHEVNHPATKHLTSDIWSVDPLTATGGRPVGLLWASPDCKHFSKAKGGKPVEKKIRGLAWVVVHWANVVSPRVIILENVEEFSTWGPLGADNKPCPLQKGVIFRRWLSELEGLGYAVEWRELRACDYGAPTIRKRLFLIARRDGLPIVWPDQTHGDPKSDAVKQRPAETLAHGGRDHRLVAAVPVDLCHLGRDHGGIRPARRAAAAGRDHGADRQGREALRAGCGKAVHRQPDASGERTRRKR
jgi:DNA (cytosine-5)-methyltransferase 1